MPRYLTTVQSPHSECVVSAQRLCSLCTVTTQRLCRESPLQVPVAKTQQSRKINFVLSLVFGTRDTTPFLLCLMIERLPADLIARRSGQTLIAGWRDPALQRISDALGSGLTSYTSGALPLGKACRLVAKLQTAFPDLTRDRKHAWRLKQAGKPRYKLVVFANRSGKTALFWLLTDQPTDLREQWLDATDAVSRLSCYQWEAVRRTKPGAALPVWTWAMAAEAFKSAKAELKSYVRSGQLDDVAAMGKWSATWPGFSAVRRQRQALAHVYAGEWRRARSDAPPAWPKLRYVQRLRTR